MTDNTTKKSFHFNKLLIELHPEVYEPAEDSFLLVESLKIDYGNTVLELGTGCGLIALECARLGANVICADVNPYATKLARRNFKKNCHMLKGNVEVRQGNLFSAINRGEIFDVIIFNPPYLPTSKEERVDKWFDISTDGGKSGLEITKRFIKNLRKYLSENGHAYFIFSSLSDRSKLEKYLNNKGFKFEVVSNLKFDFEAIDVYCLTPTD